MQKPSSSAIASAPATFAIKKSQLASRWSFDLAPDKTPQTIAPVGQVKYNEKEEISDAEKGKKTVGKAWDVVKGAFTQGLFMGFMMWMSGNGLHIFSIMFLVMFLSTPVRALFAVGPAFARFRETLGSQLIVYQVLYCLVNLFWVGVGLWKCSQMGLLPNTPSDYIYFFGLPEKSVHFFSGIYNRGQ